MLYIGLIFITLGVYTMCEDFYDLDESFKKKELIEIDNVEKDDFYKVKAIFGLFCIVVGLLSVANYFYY